MRSLVRALPQKARELANSRADMRNSIVNETLLECADELERLCAGLRHIAGGAPGPRGRRSR